ncbi:hypothetical protein CH341_17940 [Rhodoplanes roseus]|uniref:Uncharacterized protein n=1 Tax=Rhodoplanes roseus TaxID=29409 RepID=A0A327KYR0_9BRAD|nr:hypothetical protein CH341_17940 [Rhodoplanes roseus]
MQVEGIPYHVMMAEAPGGFDFRSHREENFTVMPDELAEKRRNQAAALQVARGACGTRKPVIGVESKDGPAYYTSVRCE